MRRDLRKKNKIALIKSPRSKINFFINKKITAKKFIRLKNYPKKVPCTKYNALAQYSIRKTLEKMSRHFVKKKKISLKYRQRRLNFVTS